MATYIKTLAAILALQVQQTVPSRRVPPDPNMPVRNHSDKEAVLESPTGVVDADEPVTAREAVLSYNGNQGSDYSGLGPRDVYITAPQLAEIAGYSEATARRRLAYFEEQGVVETYLEGGGVHHWELTDEFSALGDDTIRTKDEMTEAAKRLLELSQDG